MTPLPKRKFSTRRSGMRKATRSTALPAVVFDSKAGEWRLPHIHARKK
jgi:ribosomal protein L32